PDCSGIFEYFMIEQPHEQMSPGPRGTGDHLFECRADAMTRVGADIRVHLARDSTVVRAADPRRADRPRFSDHPQPHLLVLPAPTALVEESGLEQYVAPKDDPGGKDRTAAEADPIGHETIEVVQTDAVAGRAVGVARDDAIRPYTLPAGEDAADMLRRDCNELPDLRDEVRVPIVACVEKGDPSRPCRPNAEVAGRRQSPLVGILPPQQLQSRIAKRFYPFDAAVCRCIIDHDDLVDRSRLSKNRADR